MSREELKKQLQNLLTSPSLSIVRRRKMEHLMQAILNNYDESILANQAHFDASVTAMSTALHFLMAENIDLTQKLSTTVDENKELGKDVQRLSAAGETLAQALNSTTTENEDLSRENQRLALGERTQRERATRLEREKSENFKEVMACLDDASKRMEVYKAREGVLKEREGVLMGRVEAREREVGGLREELERERGREREVRTETNMKTTAERIRGFFSGLDRE